MALEEYVGAIVMEVDGQEIEVTDLKEDVTTGRKLVKTMNKTGRAKGDPADRYGGHPGIRRPELGRY